jgi:hypothetical protein
MPILKRRRVVLAKVETTYGADASPLATADAILCQSGSSISVGAEEVERDMIRATMTPLGHVVTGKTVSLSLSCELRGSGTAGSAPEIDPLLRACGLDPATVADASVIYSPLSDSDAHESVTLYWYEDGLLHKAVGCRGTMSLSLSVNGIPTISFDLSGIYADPSDAALPSPTLSDVVPPVCRSAGVAIGSYTPVATSVDLSLGNDVQQRQDINATDGIAGYMITGRKPTGSIDPEAALLADFDPWTAWKNGTTAAIEAAAGTVAGNIMTMSVPAAMYQTPSYSDRNGITTYSLPFVCTGTDDDELSLAFT